MPGSMFASRLIVLLPEVSISIKVDLKGDFNYPLVLGYKLSVRVGKLISGGLLIALFIGMQFIGELSVPFGNIIIRAICDIVTRGGRLCILMLITSIL